MWSTLRSNPIFFYPILLQFDLHFIQAPFFSIFFLHDLIYTLFSPLFLSTIWSTLCSGPFFYYFFSFRMWSTLRSNPIFFYPILLQFDLHFVHTIFFLFLLLFDLHFIQAPFFFQSFYFMWFDLHFVCTPFFSFSVDNLIYTSFRPPFYYFLVSCTQLYKPLCQLVHQSIRPLVHQSVYQSICLSVANWLEHMTYSHQPYSFMIRCTLCSNPIFFIPFFYKLIYTLFKPHFFHLFLLQFDLKFVKAPFFKNLLPILFLFPFSKGVNNLIE